MKNRIMRNGYRVTDDPEDASFILQANVLKVGKTDPDEVKSTTSTRER